MERNPLARDVYADSDATEVAMRVIEATKFPVQDMVSHTFTIEETEHCSAP
jgi:hypothetical protein